MTKEPRYAIYYTPPVDTPLWRFGSHVLGYDAATGEALPGFCVPGYPADDWLKLTVRPRTYGFHATLKAPFCLNNTKEETLRNEMASFCMIRLPFRLGPITVTALESNGQGFVALAPTQHSPELMRLEQDVVIEFDRFRRALTNEERSKRLPGSLTDRQRRYLDTYGYPFVIEEFSFHMTLTGAVINAPEIADRLADTMANVIGTVDIKIDALTLFKQAEAGSRFVVVERFPFEQKE